MLWHDQRIRGNAPFAAQLGDHVHRQGALAVEDFRRRRLVADQRREIALTPKRERTPLSTFRPVVSQFEFRR